MLETAQTANEQTWSRIHQLMVSVLPISDCRSLLIGLADAFRDVAKVHKAVVSVANRAASGLVGAVSNDKPHAKFFELADVGGGVWSADAVRLNLFDHKLLDATTDENVIGIPFESAKDIVGGVHLIAPAGAVSSSVPLDELSELSGRLIVQCRQIENCPTASPQLSKLESAKLKALAEFAAGAGHEINNPIATIAGRAMLLLKDETDPARRQALKTIGGQAYRIRDMIGDLMLFARPPEPQPEELELGEVIQDVLSKLHDAAQSRGCTFDCSIDGEVPIFADRVQLNVVLSELIQNSQNAQDVGGPIVIRACNVTVGADPLACFSVSDCGLGLSETDREHLFDPFYSGRQAGRGLGFGLCKCWKIVENHGGRIEVVSEPAGETTFTIYWPAASRPISIL